MNTKLIGILDAAHIAATSPKRIHDAMERGSLEWKALDGHQVTSREWIGDWVAGQRTR